MNEKHYLFIFDDDTSYDMTCGVSYKDAIWEMAKYTGNGSEMLLKALKGFEEDDIDGMTELYNYFANFAIVKVYLIMEVLYK